MRNYKYTLATVMAVSVIALSGCVVPVTPNTPPTSMDDANMTMLVKTALMNEAVFRVNQIRVDTIGGVVTLTGVVQTRLEADRVVEMTKTIKGVREIRDGLEIRP
jgi:hyperosmotically inducible protein